MTGLEVFIIIFFILVGVIILGLFAISQIETSTLPDHTQRNLLAGIIIILGIATLSVIAWGIDMLMKG